MTLPTVEATKASSFHGGEPLMIACSMEEAVRVTEATALGDTTIQSSSKATTTRQMQYVLNQCDHSILLDKNHNPITVDRILATKPLREEISSRPGPGGKKLLYLSGDGVTRTLNDIFGFDGWNLQILSTDKTVCQKADDGVRWLVAYIAHVRITHNSSGAFKEDMGAGDSIDKSMVTAVQHALKGSITDALKRAARHFGDKLGNVLYQDNFKLATAPTSLEEALDQFDSERAKSKFGTHCQSVQLSLRHNSSTATPAGTNGVLPSFQKQQLHPCVKGNVMSAPAPSTTMASNPSLHANYTVAPAQVVSSGSMNLHKNATESGSSSLAESNIKPIAAVSEVKPPPTTAHCQGYYAGDFVHNNPGERPGSSLGHKRTHGCQSSASTNGQLKKARVNPYT